MLSGVSSAKMASAETTWRPGASASGSRRAVDLPTRPARVDQSRSALRGRRSGSGGTAAGDRPACRPAHGADRPGPGRPRPAGRDWTNRSQQALVRRGRTMRFTMKRPGTCSSSPVTSSPIRHRHLRGCQRHLSLLRRWPDEPTLFQPLHEHARRFLRHCRSDQWRDIGSPTR